jgi:hypothetical protein
VGTLWQTFGVVFFGEARSPFGKALSFAKGTMLLCQRDKGLPKSYFWRIFAP